MRPLSQDKVSFLKRVTLFSQLEPRELEKLAQITAIKRLRARETLARKGDPGSQAYVIMKGRLRISSAGAEGKETVLRIMDPGEVVGEIALLDGQPRSASMSALEPTELLVIQRRDLIPFLERHPKTAIKLLATLTGLVRNLSNQLEDRVFLGLPSRLAKKLLALADNYGKDTAAGILIDMRIPQAALGEMVGTSRESVNKQLQTWRKQGLIRTDKLYITILDRDALEDLAVASI
jgi:CRP-like cAMP-binding protein